MKNFPNKLKVENKENFEQYNYDRTIAYIRRDIYEFMIERKNENVYFDFDKYQRNKKIIETIIETIIKELLNIGWKCKISFGGTALFIYSTDIQPSSCYDDGF